LPWVMATTETWKIHMLNIEPPKKKFGSDDSTFELGDFCWLHVNL